MLIHVHVLLQNHLISNDVAKLDSRCDLGKQIIVVYHDCNPICKLFSYAV